MSQGQNQECLVIGYYPLRGKVQVCRLLCQYLHLPYRNELFNPHQWQIYKATKTAHFDWIFQELPFLKDRNFVVTETYPISLYLINKANRKDLLGRTLEDEIKVDTFLWQSELMSMILADYVKMKDLPEEEKFARIWSNVAQPRMKSLEFQSKDNFFLGYVTIIDFYIYEIVNFLTMNAGVSLMQKFPKVWGIYQKLLGIPQIRAYECSQRAIKNICPVEFYKKWSSKCPNYCN